MRRMAEHLQRASGLSGEPSAMHSCCHFIPTTRLTRYMHPALRSTWPSMSRVPNPVKSPDLEGFYRLTQSLTDHYARRVVRLDHNTRTLEVQRPSPSYIVNESLAGLLGRLSPSCPCRSWRCAPGSTASWPPSLYVMQPCSPQITISYKRRGERHLPP